MDYSFLFLENLYIINIDNKNYLLDTASPLSYAKNQKIQIDDKAYKTTSPVVLKDRVKKLSKRIDLKVDGIIGFDIIKATGLYINKKQKKIRFGIKKLKGTPFDFSICKYNDYEFIQLTLETHGLTPYGTFNFILDSGISKTLLDLFLCNHSQYAYRKDLYYLALDQTYPTDFVFEEFYQNDKRIDVEAGMNNDKIFLSQLNDVKSRGLIALNDVYTKEMVIDTVINQIVVK